MKLILITCPEFFVEEDKILTTLFEEGLDILHLRKPNSEPVYCERLLSLMPEQFRRKIVAQCVEQRRGENRIAHLTKSYDKYIHGDKGKEKLTVDS